MDTKRAVEEIFEKLERVDRLIVARAEHIDRLAAENKALREALDNYGDHSAGCVVGEFRAGRPTADGGYESLYGYGKNEKWYQRDEELVCTCGLYQARAALNKQTDGGNDDRPNE
jgi:hypothetical protein